MAKREEPHWGHFFGIGLQVAVGVALGAVVGTWLDRKYHWSQPWGVIVGTALGLAAGLYLLFKEALKANRD